MKERVSNPVSHRPFGAACAAAALAMCAFLAGQARASSPESLAERLYKLEADLAKARLACAQGPQGRRKMCLEQAQGRFEIGKAWLEQEEEPSAESRYKTAVVSARAEREMAESACQAAPEPRRSECLREAQQKQAALERAAKERRRAQESLEPEPL